ncbi:glycosyltransferase family 2 protein [Nodularia sphaerocarpa]|uniref:glycosyltransferase family 2 protein n=1 Tax=Nodularia sphaerocarpa TaxID=137816 RepID=UPI001EFB3421|nr:glycosyltransferase family 2 protein [Nodularia sphaerocarpa]MDB9374860.1 glycosyltransferase family 2 protein [Nodularia sphaerocarpa CS-585]MDB9378880.1 glycosyltransferase family 2 protein [Nodularia sphaerocarpa CS-585A2]ULP70477.1 Putative glycosyltransferase EpsH [Nodularia sphaerocarpa UHCC 0038]
MNIKVSVIMPAYNTEKYIAKAIESFLAQTLDNIELIIVDDASSDRTVEIAKNFVDARIKILINEKNLGPSDSRNRALKEAKGEWVAVLDSDDWYAPNRLENLLQIAYSQNADMIADDLYIIQDGEDLPWSTSIQESGETINDLKIIDAVYFVETDVYGKRGLRLGLSKPIFKREFLMKHQIEYDVNLMVGEDFWLDMRCLMLRAKFVLVPQPYYYYRCREGSLVYTNQKKNLEQCCQKIIEFIKEEDLTNKYPRLAQALSHNLEVFKINLCYYQVVEKLRNKSWLMAGKEIINHPYIFFYLIKKIPGIINRRLQYYLLGNKSAFKIYN